MAIQHAMTVLQWRENLVSEEMPPEWMWIFDNELEIHFQEVDRARKAKYGISDDEDYEYEEPSVGNELVKGLKQ